MSPLRVVVTGGRGKIGRRIAAAHVAAGHDVLVTDIVRPVYDAPVDGEPPYVQADLERAGDAREVVAGADVVVNAAAIPEPSKNTAETVFGTNSRIAWNVTDAVARERVPRLINISSDSVAGMTWAHRPFVAEQAPIDESLPDRPQDAYGLSKQLSESLCDALVRRTDSTAVSIRPTWVLTSETYARNLGPLIRDRSIPTAVFWSYLDVDDLADLVVLAATSATAGHEVVYAAAADNIGGRDLRAAIARLHPQVRVGELDRVDAGGISSAKARALFGWEPTRSWRDHLDESGEPIRR